LSRDDLAATSPPTKNTAVDNNTMEITRDSSLNILISCDETAGIDSRGCDDFFVLV